jgi:hypothetical protein
MDRKLSVYWYSPEGKEVLLNDVLAFTASAHNTYNGHIFHLREKKEDHKGKLVFAHTVDGSLGKDQSYDIGSSPDDVADPVHGEL